MAVTIADLEVNIRDNGQSATLALNALINTLSKLASNIEPASKALKETTKELKTVDKTASSAARGGLGKFFKSIVRIAGYRAIRSALKMITSGFREGVQNIALYSQAIGGIDASKANKVMSAYASMGAQIKNSLGAAVMPLLAYLMPMVQKVADLFMDLADGVAKFFATLNGQATYTAANRNYWVDYAAGLDKSNKAAKELKRTILGFDEINALNSQSSGSSGSTTNYKDMFVEKTNDWFGLKDTFEWALTAVGAIGATIAAWKISRAFTSSLSDTLTFAQSIHKVLAGLAFVAISIYFSWGAGEAIATGDLRSSLIKTILGTLSGAVGGALIGSFAGPMGTLIGATIGVGISLVTTLISIVSTNKKIAKQKYWDEQIAPIFKSLGLDPNKYTEEGIQATYDVAIEIKQRVEAISTDIPLETKAKLERAQKLIDDIFSLDAFYSLDLIKQYVEELNALGLDGINIRVNDDGTLSKTKDELQGILDNIIAVEKAQALSSARQSAWLEVVNAKIKYEQAVKDEMGAYEAYLKAVGTSAENEAARIFYEKQSARKAVGSSFNKAKDKYVDIYNASGLGNTIKRGDVIALTGAIREYLDKGIIGMHTLPGYITTPYGRGWGGEKYEVIDENNLANHVKKGFEDGVYSSSSTVEEVFSSSFIEAFDYAWDGNEKHWRDSLKNVFASATEMGITGVDFTTFANLFKDKVKGIMAAQGVDFATAVKTALPQAIAEAFKNADYTNFKINVQKSVSGALFFEGSDGVTSVLQIMRKVMRGEAEITDVLSAMRNLKLGSIGLKASGGFVPSGDLFVAGEAGAELVMAAPGGSEVVNMAQFEAAMMNAVSMAGGNGGGDWTIVVQDESGTIKSRQVITAAERANRRDGRTIIPVGVY